MRIKIGTVKWGQIREMAEGPKKILEKLEDQGEILQIIVLPVIPYRSPPPPVFLIQRELLTLFLSCSKASHFMTF